MVELTTLSGYSPGTYAGQIALLAVTRFCQNWTSLAVIGTPSDHFPALQREGDRLAVVGVDGGIREAQSIVELHLSIGAERVQRAVHQILELEDVGRAVELT